MEKKACFTDLEDMIPSDACDYTTALLAKIKRERRKVERDDDVALPCVDALARNDACRAFGVPEDRRLNLIEMSVGRILPIPYRKKLP